MAPRHPAKLQSNSMKIWLNDYIKVNAGCFAQSKASLNHAQDGTSYCYRTRKPLNLCFAAYQSEGKGMNALFFLILTAIGILKFLIIVYVIASLLVSFNVINPYNRLVATITDMLYKICEPVLRPVRNLLPAMGGVDLSPLIVLVALQALEILIRSDIGPALGV